MEEWGFWEWLGYAGIAIAAIVLAFDKWLEETRIRQYRPFIALIFLLCGTVALLIHKYLDKIKFKFEYKQPYVLTTNGEITYAIKIEVPKQTDDSLVILNDVENLKTKEHISKFLTPTLLWTEGVDSYKPTSIAESRFFVLCILKDKNLSFPNPRSGDPTSDLLNDVPVGTYRVKVSLVSKSKVGGSAVFDLEWDGTHVRLNKR